ncbi:MAG TPA: 7TM diverse intracellular signaling domain-containing protein [Chitinophagaceae bacterium]|nr:7TM diverse intracellular signaling domain-containing protein [Chitinophagaceae bacterium]
MAQEKVLPVDSASEYPVHQFATYYCDENFYSINIIKSKEDKGYFKPFPKKILNEGFTNKYYWVCLRLHNALPAVNHLVFELPNNTINYTEVFQLKDSQLVSLGYTGDHFNFEHRPIQSYLFAYPLQLNAFEDQTYFVFIDKKDENLKIQFRLLSEQKFIESQNNIYFKTGIYAGILAITLLFNLFLYQSLKDPLHGWYALYVLSCIYNLLTFEGMDFQFLYPHFPAINDIAKYISTSINLFLMLLIMQKFLNQNSGNSRLFSITKIIKWSSLVYIIAAIIVYKVVPSSLIIKRSYALIYSITAVWAFIHIFLSSIEKIRQGFKPAYFYLFAIAPLIFGTIDFILNLFGLFTNFAREFNPITLGLVVEASVISFGILYRYNLFKQEKEQLIIELSQQKAMATSQIIEAQELERKRIAEDLHDELGGDLATIKVNLQSINENNTGITNALHLLDKASADVRNISHNLMPPEFSTSSLDEILSAMYKQLSQYGSTHFNFISNNPKPFFSKQEELIIYRILTELTNNIIKHSHATEASVQTIYHDNYLAIVVEDNGAGFTTNSTGGIGLKNIKSRVEYLNGTINIDSGIIGTTIIIQLPYKK